MTPLLSVVVPAYNVAEYLPDCLESLLAQTLADLEVIVVDDGSPDECGEIADDFAARDPRVKVLHTPNSGLGPARNNGARVATGRYLTFVDSDDLVPPRAFELMVSTLERTGSDFAAGNAWRFYPDKGNLPSWTHRQAFAEDRLRTSIREFPLLVRDRMAWNKVWRRSFWDRHGLEFPPIRYEDFPVVLKAHLLATSVDVLSTRVYMWRQRESGTSITQLSADLGNLRDRVRSAEMVLEEADRAGDAEIITALHTYFIDVDLITVAEGLAAASPEDEAQIAELLRRLAGRLMTQRTGPTRLARLIHRAARRGDLDAVKAMAAWRSSGDKRRLLRSMATRRGMLMLPQLAAAVTPRRSKALAVRTRRLRSTLISGSLKDGAMTVNAEIKLRATFLTRARVTAELISDNGSLPLDVSIGAPSGHSTEARILIPVETVSAHLGTGSANVRLSVTLGLLRWRGEIASDPALLPPAVELADGSWLVASHPPSGEMSLCIRYASHGVSARIDLTQDGLSVGLPRVNDGFVSILRTRPSAPLLMPVVGGTAVLSWDEVAANDPADNPANGTSFRSLVYLPASSSQVAMGAALSASATADLTEEVPLDQEQREQAAEAAAVDQGIAEVVHSVDDATLTGDEPDPLRGLDDDAVWPIFCGQWPEAGVRGRHRYAVGRTRDGGTELIMQTTEHMES